MSYKILDHCKLFKKFGITRLPYVRNRFAYVAEFASSNSA